MYESGQNLAIVIEKKQLSNKSQHSAHWCSVWKVDKDKSILSGRIFGSIHLFESGNVHVSFDKEFGSFEVRNGNSLLDCISKTEQAFQQTLDDKFDAIKDGSFKRLRRSLPITRTKIDWYHLLAV